MQSRHRAGLGSGAERGGDERGFSRGNEWLCLGWDGIPVPPEAALAQ